tara:strand:- start:6294 stop:6767 length:474 start_codon:yes stop_codon:yes gene_type:complete
MGYKKLDEVMELLTDELDGFNTSLDKLQKLTKNVDNIKVVPDTTPIEYLLKEHLSTEQAKSSRIQEAIQGMNKQLSNARVVPKLQLWFHYSIWLISLIIMGYLVFRVSRMDQLQERAFSEGKQATISELNSYFDQYPEHYKNYQNWIKEEKRIPNHK